jgi:hypothetical protein
VSASQQEVQALADQILELVGARLTSGELVISYHEGQVQRFEVRGVHRFHQDEERPPRKKLTGRLD